MRKNPKVNICPVRVHDVDELWTMEWFCSMSEPWNGAEYMQYYE